MQYMKAITRGIIPAILLATTGCGWEQFRLQNRIQSASDRPAARPAARGIDMSAAAQAAAALPAVPPPAAPGTRPPDALEQQIQKFVRQYPGNTTRKVDAPAQPAPAPAVAQAPPPGPAIQLQPAAQTQPPVAPPQPQPEPAPADGVRPAAPAAPQPQLAASQPQPAAPTPAPPKVISVAVRPNAAIAVIPAPATPAPIPIAPPTPAPAAPPNQPVPAPAELSPEESLASAIKAMENIVATEPDSLAEQFKLRLLYLLAGQDEKAQAPAEGVSNEMAVLLSALMKTVATTQASASDRNAATDEALLAINEFRDLLRQHADLAIPRVALCQRVDSFGVFEELTTRSFAAGQAASVIVYCEVQNFVTEKTSADLYRTLLAQRLEVLTPQGDSVWSVESAEIEDVSRNRREDFFLAQVVQLPETLAPGEYILNVIVEDKLGAKSNEAKIDFTITAGK